MIAPKTHAASKPVETVYIVEPQNQGWIIERLMRDIAAQLELMGIACKVGSSEGYQGEDVIFNSRYLTATADTRARVNSLFVTHVDDRIKELELRSSRERFNSFVCMSGQEADFISGLLGSDEGVVGIDLPTRGQTAAPTRLALFTARYEDGRKNEQWLLNYFSSRGRAERDGFIICLMGWGWESFCAQLAELEMNYEVYRYSRFTPGEYDLYKARLASMDYLAYLGFDGGAMCVYDAIGAGVDVIATDISYHRGLGSTVSLIASEADFATEMDRLHQRHAGRLDSLQRRSVVAYTRALTAHWNTVAEGGTSHAPIGADKAAAQAESLQLFRSHYKPIGLSRVRSFAIRVLQNILNRRR